MHPEVIAANWQLITSGLVLTLEIALVALAIGIVFGVLTAIARTSGPAPIAALATCYVEVMRNTPVLVQLRDQQNRLVFSWTTKADRTSLKPGEEASINESRIDIPKNAENLSLTFVQ